MALWAFGVILVCSPERVRATPIADVSPAELASYTQLYQLPIPDTFNFNSVSGIAGVPYSVNHTADIAVGSFTRVAYYFELQLKVPAGSNRQWVWVSMDTPNTNPAMLGVPNAGTGIVYNGTVVGNLHIESNSGLITPGNFANGDIEFWASNYDGNGSGKLGSNNSNFDWGDSGGNSTNGHGSMQVFNYALGQCLFGFNGLSQNGHMGIGTQSGGANNSYDWTFDTNANLGPAVSYSIKNLEVWVNPPPPATLTWDGFGNGNWTASRWTGGPPAFPNNTADAIVQTNTVTVTGAQQARVLTVNSGGVQIDPGGSLTMAQSGTTLTVAPGAVLTLNGGVTGATLATPSGGGTISSLVFNGLGTINNGSTLSVGALSDGGAAGTLTKQGAGDLVLNLATGPSTITAGTSFNVQAGRLVAVRSAANNPLGGAPIALNGGSLGLSSTAGGTFDNAVAVNQNATITAQLASPGMANQAVTLGSASNGITIANTRTLTLATADGYMLNIGGSIGGGGGLTSAGTVNLNAANGFTGATTVSSGTLTVNHASALSATSGITVNSGATLAVSGVPLTITGNLDGPGALSLGSGASVVFSSAAAQSVSTPIIGSGGLTKLGAGTLTLEANSSYTGSTIISEGTVRLTEGLAAGAKIMPLGDSITYGSGGTLAGYRGPLYGLLTGAGYTSQFVGSTNGNPGSLPATPVNQQYHEGHGGWVTGDVGTGILHGVKTVATGGLGWLTVNPDLVLLHIGTNNTGGSEPQSILDVGGILDQIYTQRPTATTLVAQIIPKNGATAWVTQYNTDLASLVATRQAAGYRVGLVDMNTSYPLPLATTLPDGVHPNDTGYTWMAQQWYSAIATIGGGLPTASAVSIASGAALDLNGVNQIIGSLADGGGGGGLVTNTASGKPATLTFSAPSGVTSFSGTIADGASPISLGKTGGGTQVLAGPNTFTGATNVAGGTLAVNHASALSTTSGITLASGATLAVNASGQFPGNITGPGTINVGSGVDMALNSGAGAQTCSAPIVGNGSLMKLGSGTLTLKANGTYAGSTTISQGTLLLSGTAVPAGAAAIYTFDNLSGGQIVNEGSLGTAKNATLNSGATIPTGTGHVGNGVYISGWNGGYVGVLQGSDSKGLDLSGGSWTASIWYKDLIGGNDWHTLFHAGSNDNYQTIISEGNRHVGTYAGGFSDSNYVVPSGDTGWHMFTTVGSPGSTKFYIDGTYVAQTNSVSVSDIYSIGAHQSNVHQFARNLDDFYFYQQALAPAEVTTLYDATRGAASPTNVLPSGTPLSIAAGAALDLNGVNQTVASLADIGGAGGLVTNSASGKPSTLTFGAASGVTSFSGTIADGASPIALGKTGGGTQVLAGPNAYAGTTTVSQGTLVAASNSALGTAAAGTVVESGGTLGLQGGVTISGEAITLNGTGAAGRPGALANIGGSNLVVASSPIAAKQVALGEIGIGSASGTLAVNAPVDLQLSKLTVNGAGNTVVNGVISGIGHPVAVAPIENTKTATQVFNNVPEANGYVLAYELIPNGGVTGASFPYTVNNAATVQPFDRVAYYMELDGKWVYASMDAFTTNLSQIGIPYGSTLFKFQQKVNNMNVLASAGSGITSGTGLATGNIEIWPSDYNANNDIGIPNANSGTYDFGDGGSSTSVGYGSFQVHNYDLDGAGPGTAGQTLFAYNTWRGGGDLGIANKPSGNPDWTFSNNYGSYTWRRLAILVHETASRILDCDNSLVKTGSGTLILNGDNTYNGTTTVNGGTLLVNGHTSGQGSYSVQTGATLGGTGTIGLAPGKAVTFGPGSFLSPGLSPGTLTINGDMIMDNGSTYIWELGANAYDVTAVTGSLTLHDWTLRLVDAGGVAHPGDVYYFFLAGGLTDLGNMTVDWSGAPLWRQNTEELTFGFDGTGAYLTGLQSLPEPTTLTLLALGGLGLWRRRTAPRRRGQL